MAKGGTKGGAKHQAFIESLAHRGASGPKCRAPIVNELTPEQLAAMHACKHEMLAAVFRLYKDVPQKIADDLVGEFINEFVKKRPHV
jgi:hypothetical protein